MATWVIDLRHAWRSLLRAPGFAGAALVLVVLGVGANALLFALADGLLLRPLPGVAEVDRLYANTADSMSYPDVRATAAASGAPGSGPLAGVAAWSPRDMVLGAADGGDPLRAHVVTGGYFATVGAPARLGRVLGPEDDRAGAPPTVVLGYALWQSRFAGAASVLGQTVRLNGQPFTVVGVAAPDFRGLRLDAPADLFVAVWGWAGAMPTTFGARSPEMRGWGWLNMVVRARTGATAKAAQVALREELARQLQPGERPTSVRLTPAALASAGLRSPAQAAAIAAAFAALGLLLLLLACASLAQLVLARGADRQRELAARAALGATAGRLRRAALAEPLLLALLGCGASLLLLPLGLRALGGVTLPGQVALASLPVHVDLRVALFAAGVAAAAVLLFGAMPSRGLLRLDVMGLLRGGRGVSRRRGTLLIATQAALSVTLVGGALLLARAIRAASAIDTGFAERSVVVAWVEPGLARYDDARALAYYEDALRRVRALPGVAAAAWSSVVPLLPDYDQESIVVPGYVPPAGKWASAEPNLVTPDYFATLGVRIVRGRALAGEDVHAGQATAVISEAMERAYWNGRDAVGTEFRIQDRAVRVVGVARDVHAHALDEVQRPTAYLCMAPGMPGLLNGHGLIVRLRGEAAASVAPVLAALRAAGPDVPVPHYGTFEDLYGIVLARQRLGAALFALFGALGLALAAAGVYGIVAQAVARRRWEIGLRLALGARPRDVRELFLRHGLRGVGLGVALGLALSAGLGFALRGLLYGVPAVDPWSLGGAALLLAAVGAAAAALPAWRAARVEPSVALRVDA